ncbi:hypothetical protein KIN20_004464 [Parelaphostrongylus tenuis]|uniref:MADF domain-containing protein n=1 Tax=Parelaphostrongylus tenuis TaxID=148309 RepID=A0AAD5LYH8_PARTN|nr:hypothetical protein KIN20_004464 [Parelaphostrongylus tenuis]
MFLDSVCGRGSRAATREYVAAEWPDCECVSTATNRSTHCIVVSHGNALICRLIIVMKPKTALIDLVPSEEWDAKSKVTLIHCYRDEPVLWNVSVGFRSDAERRQYHSEAWIRIEQRMNTMGYTFELPQLKRKMKQLRDQFIRENKMFENHSSKWQFYEEMRFLNQEAELSSGCPISFVDSSPLKQSTIEESQSISVFDRLAKEQEAAFQKKTSFHGGESTSPEMEIKSEILDDGRAPHTVQEKSGVMVSSSGIVLSETVMDELLRLCLSHKDIILNDASDEEAKDLAWNGIHEFVQGITTVTPPIDELKEVFRRKLVHISDIVAKHTKADVFSVHGFTRYIQSIVDKCLPEERYSAKERELGTYVLRKSFSQYEPTPPLAKKSRMTNGSVEDYEDISRLESPSRNGAKALSRGDNSQRGSCSCHIGDDCLKNTILEMMKAQSVYFTAAAEAQREQVRFLAALGEVLNRVSVNLQPRTSE